MSLIIVSNDLSEEVHLVTVENGATRQQIADVTGVDVKTIYKYLPAT
ncbi:TPA: helix-turn-helix domain-containing protein [Klebsiella pneumoniae]